MNRILALLSLLLIAVNASKIEYVHIRSVADKAFFLHEIDTPEDDIQQVSSLDFSQAKGVGPESLRNVFDDDIILQGYLAPTDRPSAEPKFVILNEYRALYNPNPHTLSTKADYYILSVRNPQIQCFVEPCPNLLAENITSGEITEFSTLDIDHAEDAAVDRQWLYSRVFEAPEDLKAIVFGSFQDGKTEAGGIEKVFVADKIYIHNPDRLYQCTKDHDVPDCDLRMQHSYIRDSDRCLHFYDCVSEDVMCTRVIPECSEGYVLISYISATGCPQYYCDPSFLYSKF
jgi:hypothetical protein